MQLILPDIKIKRFLGLLILVNFIYSFEIPTCCPQGYNVKKVGNEFICDYYSDNFVINPINGIFIENSNRINIPKCEKIRIKPISKKNVVLSRNSCVTHLNGEYVILSCPAFEKLRGIISALKKCCPIGESYDYYKRSCEKFNINFEVFKNVISHPTIFEYDSLNCHYGSVVVQYFSINQTFEFDISDLNVDGHRFSSELYCLDTVITKFSIDELNSSHYGLLSTSQIFMVRTCHQSISICEQIPCIRRCCGNLEKINRINLTSICQPYSVDMDVNFHRLTFEYDNITTTSLKPKAFGILQHQKCAKSKLEPNEEHYFDYATGNLYIPQDKRSYDHNEYCVEYLQRGDKVERGTFLCSIKIAEYSPPFYVYFIILSCIFLFLTLCVYILVPKLMNLHGKALTGHVISLLVGYIILATFQLQLVVTNCYGAAIIMYFCLIAAFSWLNVICMDIWRTLSSISGFRIIRKSSDWKWFSIYSAYAWGIAFICTLITFVMDQYKIGDTNFHPNLGIDYSCWFDMGGWAHILYFLVPIGILVVINIILFILTLRYCNKIKRDIFKMKSLDREKVSYDKDQMAMNVRLFVVMGVSWILEIFSSLFPAHQSLFYLSDVFHALQGVFIFIIFVFKRSVLNAIKQRFGITTKFSYHDVTTETNMGKTTTSISNG